MADNVEVASGTGIPVATEEIGGFHHQKMKVEFGGTDVATMVEQVAPLPVRFGSPTAANLTSVAINAASSGDNSLVTATASQTTRVYKFFMVNAGATDVNVKFRSATTDFHPASPLKPGGSFTLDFDGEPWFVTAANEALNLNLSAAVQVSGRAYYTKSA